MEPVEALQIECERQEVRLADWWTNASEAERGLMLRRALARDAGENPAMVNLFFCLGVYRAYARCVACQSQKRKECDAPDRQGETRQESEGQERWESEGGQRGRAEEFSPCFAPGQPFPPSDFRHAGEPYPEPPAGSPASGPLPGP